jgi:hypothetical protein
MSEPYRRHRTFYQNASGSRRILATDSGVITLAANPNVADTVYVQKIHIEVTTVNAGGELWTFQDSAGTPIPVVPSISTASIAHFDFDFGPDGVPMTEGKTFDINITVATGAVGWVTWEAYRKRTAVVAA